MTNVLSEVLALAQLYKTRDRLEGRLRQDLLRSWGRVVAGRKVA